MDTVGFVREQCIDPKCGVYFLIPQHVHDQARKDPNRWVVCPNGHAFHWKESEADRLKTEIERLRRDLESAEGCMYGAIHLLLAGAEEMQLPGYAKPATTDTKETT